MEKKTNQNKNNGLGNGFVLGLIVGVIITLLLSTKKGREILKNLTEKGLNKFSDLQNSLNVTEEEFEEEIQGDDYIPPVPQDSKKEIRYLAEEQKETAEKPAKKAEKIEAKVEKNEKGGEATFRSHDRGETMFSSHERGEAKKEVRKFFKFKK